jgi:hypothetical protein
VVPPSHTLDSRPVLPYLLNPRQSGLRRYNFTQGGAAVKPPSAKAWPTILTIGPVKACNSDLFITQALAEDNGGEWFGPSEQFPNGQYATCCEAKATWAIRNERYKLVLSQPQPCQGSEKAYEFYDLRPTRDNPAGLDTDDLLTAGKPLHLNTVQKRTYLQLRRALAALLKTEPDRPGDGNLDRKVDANDLQGVQQFWGQPSWFDFNDDGTTDGKDQQIVVDNFGKSYVPRGDQ